MLSPAMLFKAMSMPHRRARLCCNDYLLCVRRGHRHRGGVDGTVGIAKVTSGEVRRLQFALLNTAVVEYHRAASVEAAALGGIIPAPSRLILSWNYTERLCRSVFCIAALTSTVVIERELLHRARYFWSMQGRNQS